MSTSKFTSDLIAPCGMNCGICKQYLARLHGIPKERCKVSHCQGCIPRGKTCYVKRGCQKLLKHQISHCSQCPQMPCAHLARLDKRYRERYGMSMVENLKMLKAVGMDAFLKAQEERHKCPDCGGLVCVHDGKCYVCGYKRNLQK